MGLSTLPIIYEAQLRSLFSSVLKYLPLKSPLRIILPILTDVAWLWVFHIDRGEIPLKRSVYM